MMYYGDHMSGWAWFGMSVGAVVFWALMIAVIIVLVRSWRSESNRRPPTSPKQVLAERFARGEIDEAEYRSRLAALEGRVSSGT